MSDNSKLTAFGQQESQQGALIISSEQEAWELLEKLQNENFQPPERVELKDWYALNLYLKGDKWDSSITPSLFPVFEALQRVVYHAYAYAEYGSKHKRLTKEERDQLEIIIRVTGGSANQSGKFNLTAIGKACVSKMDGKQVLIAIITITLAIASVTAWGNYLETAKDTRLIELSNADKKQMLEHLEFITEEQRKQIELLISQMNKNEIAHAVEDDIEDLHKEMLKSATKAEKSVISGIRLDKETATELVKSKRNKPQPMQINGLFQILNIDWGIPHHIKLKRVSDELIVSARFDLMWLSEDAKQIIQSTEWKEDGQKIFKANINARVSSDGKIASADLVTVDRVTNDEP